MKQTGTYWVIGLASSAAMAVLPASGVAQLRPPAVPLVTNNPYLSIWSESDTLNGDVTRHWTHHPQSLESLIRVDGKTYRLMGIEPAAASPMKQVALTVTATKTSYAFKSGQVKVVLDFLTPALPTDLDVYSRPVTYLNWTVRSLDGKSHDVQLYTSMSSELAVNEPSQKVVWNRKQWGSLTALKIGTADQTLFSPMGDDVRIDWGYAYLLANRGKAVSAIAPNASLLAQFLRHGHVDGGMATVKPTAPADGRPTAAFTFNLGSVSSSPTERQAMVGYDQAYNIDYYGQKLRPYWRRTGAGPAELFQKAAREYSGLEAKCASFDRAVDRDADKVGGTKYAEIVSLAYRQCVAANGLAADSNGKPLLFTKENTSNGDIATVDVIYPMDPIWVLMSPTLAKASLEAVFQYAASPRWKFPNAPHDLGTYPRVFGRDDGGEGMPVEESGNMIILADAIAHAEGTPEYASRWWKQLTKWADYLTRYGLDPENQLCTDDFMGHLAHNANLSVKAIVALAAYGDLCRMRGDEKQAKKYFDMAKIDAAHWVKVADERDHSVLAFDKPGTWSQKYNLVWDSILGLNVFPISVAQKEIAYYLTKLNKYGLPLDSRTKLTKTDWTIWSASMAPSKSVFMKFIDPIYRYLNETTTRDPISDSYVTDDIHSGGMHARPVIGGVFIRFLTNHAIWKEWASKDKAKVSGWAPIPKKPVIKEIVATAQHASPVWSFTFDKPDASWILPSFDDSAWQSGKAGFGTKETPNAIVGTVWNTPDVWLRRTVTLPKSLTKSQLAHLELLVYHDEDVQVYLNGQLVLSVPGYENDYRAFPLSAADRARLTAGEKLTIAVHCHQTSGGQGVDVGLCTVTR